MATQRILDMGFNTELGKTQRIKIHDAKDPISGSEVAAAMDEIIGKNIFDSSGGDLSSKKDARLVTTDITELSLE